MNIDFESVFIVPIDSTNLSQDNPNYLNFISYKLDYLNRSTKNLSTFKELTAKYIKPKEVHIESGKVIHRYVDTNSNKEILQSLKSLTVVQRKEMEAFFYHVRGF